MAATTSEAVVVVVAVITVVVAVEMVVDVVVVAARTTAVVNTVVDAVPKSRRAPDVDRRPDSPPMPRSGSPNGDCTLGLGVAFLHRGLYLETHDGKP